MDYIKVIVGLVCSIGCYWLGFLTARHTQISAIKIKAIEDATARKIKEISARSDLNGTNADSVIIDEWRTVHLEEMYTRWLKVIDSGVSREELPFVCFVMEQKAMTDVQTLISRTYADRNDQFGRFTIKN